MHDGAAGGQRIRRGSGRRGDNQAVGALVIDELAINTHLDFDQPARVAFGHHHVVERQHIKHLLLPAVRSAPHRGFEQHPLLGHVLAVEYRGNGLEHGVERNVGQESEPPLIDADQRHVTGRKGARNVEHGAVAADDDGEIGFAAQFVQHQHGIRAIRDVGGRQPVNQHLDAAFFKKARELHDRPGDLRGVVFADQCDGGKSGGHGDHC